MDQYKKYANLTFFSSPCARCWVLMMSNYGAWNHFFFFFFFNEAIKLPVFFNVFLFFKSVSSVMKDERNSLYPKLPFSFNIWKIRRREFSDGGQPCSFSAVRCEPSLHPSTLQNHCMHYVLCFSSRMFEEIGFLQQQHAIFAPVITS